MTQKPKIKCMAQKPKLLKDAKLADLVRELNKIGPVNCGANNIRYDIAHGLFDEISRIDDDDQSGLTIQQTWDIAMYLTQKLKDKYVIATRR